MTTGRRQELKRRAWLSLIGTLWVVCVLAYFIVEVASGFQA